MRKLTPKTLALELVALAERFGAPNMTINSAMRMYYGKNFNQYNAGRFLNQRQKRRDARRGNLNKKQWAKIR